MRIAYLVQDLADPAVERRVATLRRGGAEVDLYGFHRTGGVPPAVAGVKVHDIGETKAAKLVHRAVAMARQATRAPGWAQRWIEADLIIARNLDNLALAALARMRLKLTTPLIYELLDVRSIMLKGSPVSRLLRAVEGRLLDACAGVVVSSPAFETHYLAHHYPRRPQVILVENKVLDGGRSGTVETPDFDGPWRIGWFGAVRCRASIEGLSKLLKARPGLFEVHIRGSFVDTMIGDVSEILQSTPGLFYHGPYKFAELPGIYAGTHFTWAVDLGEAGANSDWLLPNRLYEGGLHGSVPIALRNVETGRWLSRRGLGCLVDLPLEDSVLGLLNTMTPEAYRALATRLGCAERCDFQWTDEECRSLVTRLAKIGQDRVPPRLPKPRSERRRRPHSARA